MSNPTDVRNIGCPKMAAVLACSAMLAGATGGVSHARAETLDVRYDIFISHVLAFNLKYRVRLQPGSYSSSVDFDPTTFAGLFIKIKMDLATQGKFAGGTLKPERFQMVTKKKKRKKHFDVTWKARAKPKTKRSNEISKGKIRDIESVLKPGMPDPISAMLRAGIEHAEKPCRHTERVYNGKEVYDLHFSFEKTDVFGKKDGGVYRGPSYKCKMQYKSVAGLSVRAVPIGEAMMACVLADHLLRHKAQCG